MDSLHESEAGITAEIMAVIEQAAAAYLGRKVRIVSVRTRSQGGDESNAWTEQGRATVQAAHNLVQRGH